MGEVREGSHVEVEDWWESNSWRGSSDFNGSGNRDRSDVGQPLMGGVRGHQIARPDEQRGSAAMEPVARGERFLLSLREHRHRVCFEPWQVRTGSASLRGLSAGFLSSDGFVPRVRAHSCEHEPSRPSDVSSLRIRTLLFRLALRDPRAPLRSPRTIDQRAVRGDRQV